MKIENVYRECFPGVNGVVCITHVLTVDNNGMYAVYSGVGPDMWVAEQGDKNTFFHAIRKFPNLTHEQYRD